MQKVNIQFGGITRNTDDEMCRDGECMELINMRLKDGSLQPVGNPILKASLSDRYKTAYYHSLADKYLMIKDTDESVDVYDNSFKFISTLSPDIKDVKRLEFIGNIVCVVKEGIIEYCLHIGGVYKYIGSKPPVPRLMIGQKTKTEMVVTESEYYYQLKGEDSDLDIHNIGYSFFNECISLLEKNGYFVDITLIKFGLRMFDGNYIYISPAFMAWNKGSENVTFKFGDIYSANLDYFQSVNMSIGKMVFKPKSSADSKSIYEFAVMGFMPTLSFSNLNLESWKDLIIGIDVFASRSIMCNELKDNIEYTNYRGNDIISGTGLKYHQYQEKKDKLIKDIQEEHQFYKIAEYDINGNLINRIDDVRNDSISLEQMLDEDSYSTLDISADYSYVYNSRLHLGSIKNLYSKGWGSNYLSPLGASTTTYAGSVSTYINTDKGLVIVKQLVPDIPNMITPLLSYPDNRAYKMTICVNGKRKDFALSKHKYLNIAVFLNTTTITITGGRNEEQYSYPDLSEDDISKWGSGVDDIVEQNTILYRQNVIKVSELNNPFIFPSKTTYQPSTQPVVGMCSNTTALSQGQFGEHPLFVFCEDGIYAMTVGTDVVYATSRPMSRHVCTSGKSIKGLDQVVAFATIQGLMVVSGSDVECISTGINGFLPSCSDSSPIIKKILDVAKFGACISAAEFKDYIVGAEIGYNSKEREVIVSNCFYPYSYVYSLTSQSWFKIPISIRSFVNTYPDILALSEVTNNGITTTNVYDMDNSHRSVSTVALVTRPIKMGTMTLKRIVQSALRAIVKRSLSDLYLRGESVKLRGEDLTIFSDVGFYILGSNDAEHFNLIAGKEKMVDIRDLITKMNKSKPYKFFMVCLIGGVRTDVAINYIECMVDESFTNRLR